MSDAGGGAGGMVVEPAQLSDQGKLGPLLLAVYGRVLGEEAGRARRAGWPESSVEDELMAADDFYFSNVDLMNCCVVARTGGELIGAACINPYVAEIQYVAVLPDYRRRGVGSRLVAGALAELRRRGIDHVRADAPAECAEAGGLAFLEKLGFAEVRARVSFGRKV